MRKLISIGMVIALLVTFLVPVAVLGDEQDDRCADCGVDAPCPAETPTDCGTDTMGGALLWTLLGTTFIMGRAVGDVTEHLAGTLGCWVDELAIPTFGVIGALTEGLGGLLGGLGTLLGMESIFDPLGQMLTDLAGVIADLLP